MAGRTDVLVMVARERGSAPFITTRMQRIKETATCDFGCGERVIYNRLNIQAIKDRGQKPILICAECFRNGKHVRQGFQSPRPAA